VERSEVELRLPPEPVAPALARAALAAIGSDLPNVVISDAQLLTTEVVSNAVRHANLKPSQEIVLRVAIDGYVRVEVLDPGPPFRTGPRSTQDREPSGWGLFILDRLANAWGVEPMGTGKMVWFEIATTDRAVDPEARSS
jgi:anti-sigma regulatory factor (Ser/Thr protein kinase)